MAESHVDSKEVEKFTKGLEEIFGDTSVNIKISQFNNSCLARAKVGKKKVRTVIGEDEIVNLAYNVQCVLREKGNLKKVKRQQKRKKKQSKGESKV